MRAKWKSLVISPLLYKYFFLKRPTSCLFRQHGKFQFNSVGHRNEQIRSRSYRTLISRWYEKMSRESRKFLFVCETDRILPIYRNRKFWVNSGKRLVPVIVDYNKIGDQFSMYRYTKKYSPIHRGTSFVFKGVHRRGKFQPFFNRRKGKSGRPVWGNLLKKSGKGNTGVSKKKLIGLKKVKKK